MRLAIVSQQGGKPSGAEHALMDFVRLLSNDFELHWFFFEDGDFAQTVRQGFGTVTIIEMSHRLAGVKRSNLLPSALFDVMNLTVRLTRALRAAQPDMVLTNSMKAHIVGSIAAKFAGLRCLNYLHDVIEGKALSLLRVTSALCATERLTCSGVVKRQLALPCTSVAYAAIDTGHFANLPSRDEARRRLGIPVDDLPVVAMVGRIERWKRQDLFLTVAAAVARRLPAHFCIIGSALFSADRDYERELDDIVKRNGLANRVTFVPWQHDMRMVYAAIDVSCNCSIREPFGRTSLEALASGVPIVCFDDAGICEIFEQGRGGIRVPANDWQAFADAITSLLDSPVRMAQSRVDARQAAELLDVRRVFPVFFHALSRVAAPSMKRRNAPAIAALGRADASGVPAQTALLHKDQGVGAA